jgi:two-component system cell cycle sensor histidine kinase/response regulator CckA
MRPSILGPEKKALVGNARRNRGPSKLLITDVVMPEMNGAALADALQKILPSAKQLFMSGYTADVLVRHLASQDNFIAKPFSNAELGARVRAILRA